MRTVEEKMRLGLLFFILVALVGFLSISWILYQNNQAYQARVRAANPPLTAAEQWQAHIQSRMQEDGYKELATIRERCGQYWLGQIDPNLEDLEAKLMFFPLERYTCGENSAVVAKWHENGHKIIQMVPWLGGCGSAACDAWIFEQRENGMVKLIGYNSYEYPGVKD